MTEVMFCRPARRNITHWPQFRTKCDHATRRTTSNTGSPNYCDIESEFLDRYRPGGHHPIAINDTFHFGRYRVLQKLGWGSYSTVWLVYDSKLLRLAALKVLVSEIDGVSNESRILHLLSLDTIQHKGHTHLRKLTDRFAHDGPNGRHQCLVFGVDGVSALKLLTQCRRLSGILAWELSKQVTVALDCLHSNGIAHGDLHTGNILVSQSEAGFSDPGFLKKFGEPVQVNVNTECGHQISKSLPRTLVESAVFPMPSVDGEVHARLIDFEQSFLHTDKSLAKVRTPLVYRAPETLLDTKWDLRMDIWSLACTLFELVVGQPPFDNFMPAKAPLVLEWMAMFGDVPREWRKEADDIIGDCKDKIDPGSLSKWLRETYFDGERRVDFAEADITRLGDLLTKMMCYRPEHRLSTQDILRHEWFVENPLADGPDK